MRRLIFSPASSGGLAPRLCALVVENRLAQPRRDKGRIAERCFVHSDWADDYEPQVCAGEERRHGARKGGLSRDDHLVRCFGRGPTEGLLVGDGVLIPGESAEGLARIGSTPRCLDGNIRVGSISGEDEGASPPDRFLPFDPGWGANFLVILEGR